VTVTSLALTAYEFKEDARAFFDAGGGFTCRNPLTGIKLGADYDYDFIAGLSVLRKTTEKKSLQNHGDLPQARRFR